MASQMQLEIFGGKLYGQPRFVKQRQFQGGNCFYIPVGCLKYKARLIVKSTILTILEHREEKDRENHT